MEKAEGTKMIDDLSRDEILNLLKKQLVIQKKLKSKQEELQVENDELKSQLEVLKNTANFVDDETCVSDEVQKEDLRKQVEISRSQVASLNERCEHLENLLQKKLDEGGGNEEFKCLQADNMKLLQKINSLQEQIFQITEENSKVIEEKTLKIKMLERERASDDRTNFLCKESAKQNSNDSHRVRLLEIELNDFKDTVSKLNEDLTQKTWEIDKINKEKDSLNQCIVKNLHDIENLRSVNDGLKEKLNKSSEVNSKAEEEMKELKRKFEERFTVESEYKSKIEEFIHEIDSFKAKEISLVSEIEHLKNEMIQNNDIFQKTISSQENQIKLLNEDKESLQDQLDTLMQEHESYKTRAKEILKNKQTLIQNDALVSQLREEVTAYKKQVTHLERSLESLTVLNSALEKEKDSFTQKYTAKCHEVENLKKSLDERSKEMKDLREMLEENFENSTKSLYSENEHLRLIILAHEKSNDGLKSEIAELKLEIQRMESLLKQSENKTLELKAEMKHLEGKVLQLQIENTDVALKQEDKNGITDLNSLLVNSSISADETPKRILFSESSATDKNNQIEYLQLTLSDVETENLRLKEQLSLLKSELRRIERNQERSNSITNFEYLKNVIFKFLTAKQNDERVQLLPVLSKMLVFSADELDILNVIARGSAAGNEGWFSFLGKIPKPY